MIVILLTDWRCGHFIKSSLLILAGPAADDVNYLFETSSTCSLIPHASQFSNEIWSLLVFLNIFLWR